MNMHTTTETTPLAPCPFCGAPAHGYAIEPHSHSPSLMRLIPELPDHHGSYVIEGQCACGSGLIGADEAEVVARWNRRALQPMAPTDAELDELRQANSGRLNFVTFSEFRTIARAVLEKWGNPAVAGEQVGWMWQHDETGRTGFVDCWQVENGWQDGNPRLRLISKLYATPQPTQAQAGAVPLTDEQVEALITTKHFREGYELKASDRTCLAWYRLGVRDGERAHGITGGQHGADI